MTDEPTSSNAPVKGRRGVLALSTALAMDFGLMEPSPQWRANDFKWRVRCSKPYKRKHAGKHVWAGQK